ncbi:MAG: DUF92 domain-containing protein [Acidobacteriaceae bacterium]|jgi:uncharacterized protein (TIGR00297 family)
MTANAPIPLKAIPSARDRLESRILVWTVVPLLFIAAAEPAVQTVSLGDPIRPLLLALLFSLAFAAIVWLLRSATAGAAAVGFLICMVLAQSPTRLNGNSMLQVKEVSALITLYLLTFAATRFGRARKEARGLAEARTGRRASQVIANLGISALCAALDPHFTLTSGTACIAALAEATADTLSSEIGQAIGGPAFLITTLRRVPPGTDGAISLPGTLAGLLGAAVVICVGIQGAANVHILAFAAATLGLFFDSLLGATLERRGWVGNDLVNFSSTAFGAAISLIAMRVLSTNPSL